MNKIVFLILQSVLRLACSTSLRVIKPNVLALEVTDLSSSEVLLHCGEQVELEDIHWERNGESIAKRGNHIIVTIDGLCGGNFTCHKPNGELLNYTLLVVHPVQFPRGGILTQSDDREFVTCTAKNYSGHFHCSWRWHRERSQRAIVYFSAIRNSSVLNCTVDADISGVTCIDMHYCPYSEESRSINLTLLVRNLYRLEEHHRIFLIRDIGKGSWRHLLVNTATTGYTHHSLAFNNKCIVKPDKVTFSKIEDDVFEWHPPETWSFPCSFFPLSYEVKVIPNKHNCNFTGNRVEQHETNETHYMANTRKAYTFCVRAQDPLTKRAWSDWSHHHQKKHRHSSDQ